MPNNHPVTTLRVIAGELKGRKLASPRIAATHPMGAREKNALFNMVDVQGRQVLDAYAGSGALGIEALSRGARQVVFVENHPQAISTIKQNLASLSLADESAKTEIFAGKVADFVKDYTGSAAFDVIIADPPYDKVDLAEIAALTALLVPGGVLVVSTSSRQPAPDIAGLALLSSHTYAEARITVLARKSLDENRGF